MLFCCRIKSSGVDLSLVRAEEDSFGGWKLVAARSVNKGKFLFEIPRKLCIHGSNVTAHPIIGSLYRLGIQKITNFDSSRGGTVNGMMLLLHYVRDLANMNGNTTD
jgi:hypothetical protein